VHGRVRWTVCASVCFVRGRLSWAAQRILRPIKASLSSSSSWFCNSRAFDGCAHVVRSDRRSEESCARRVCRRRNSRRSRACPENIRKPYARTTEPVGHTNSMRGGSYYCRGLSSSVVAALSAKNRKRTLRVDFDRLIRGCAAPRDADRSDRQIQPPASQSVPWLLPTHLMFTSLAPFTLAR
jgi:hypothetical protein